MSAVVTEADLRAAAPVVELAYRLSNFRVESLPEITAAIAQAIAEARTLENKLCEAQCHFAEDIDDAAKRIAARRGGAR